MMKKHKINKINTMQFMLIKKMVVNKSRWLYNVKIKKMRNKNKTLKVLPCAMKSIKTIENLVSIEKEWNLSIQQVL